jgi:DNA-binding CsgD family transcriptional regulator/PAS domain-containing protein
MRRDSTLEAIGLLYDAALGKAEWSEVGQRLITLVDGSTLTFTAQYDLRAKEVDFVDLHGMTPKGIDLYATEYAADDLWINAAFRQKLLNRGVLNTDLVSELEWRHSRFYTDFCVPTTDIFHAAIVVGTLPENGAYALGIHRPRKSRPFKATAAAQLQKLLPHLQSALQIRARLGLAGMQERASAAVLDKLAFGVIQLDARGRLLTANAVAHRILERNDGLALSRLGLRASSSNDDARLQRAIVRAGNLTAAVGDQDETGGYLRIGRPSGAKPYNVVVAPLGLDRVFLSSYHAVTMLIVTDPDSEASLDVQAMRALFGFSPAEARIVALLVTGRALPDIARGLKIGFETARTLVARARAKAEATSQVDLVRIVLMALSPLQATKR